MTQNHKKAGTPRKTPGVHQSLPLEKVGVPEAEQEESVPRRTKFRTAIERTTRDREESNCEIIAEAFASQDLTWRIEKPGVARSGELGYTSGPYVVTFKDAAGKTLTDKGKYLTVWEKHADGSWKVLFDMFNSDLPAFPPS